MMVALVMEPEMNLIVLILIGEFQGRNQDH
jgi:hypothetical protein